ncbi:CD81 protein [Amia ocellicauda]|uniref:CD81 protein n=1 Tax=Amia ocellicauda TaxID=2972642 RepID=UPI00346454C1|nr:CD81 protein [Amia calva]
MGVEGCTKCIKYVLFFFNFIFWLAGGVILGVALWLRHDTQTSSLLSQKLEGDEVPNTFYIGVYILIAVGAVMMFVGFLGCYGAIQESQCLLGTFFACLVILFACEVAAGIWGFINKDQISKELINFYDTAYDKVTISSLTQDDSKTAREVLKVFHESLKCCGKGDASKFFTIIGNNDLCPGTTFVDAATGENCHTRIKELFTSKLYLIGIAALVVAVIMIFEMIFSMVLCCGIRNSSVY